LCRLERHAETVVAMGGALSLVKSSPNRLCRWSVRAALGPSEQSSFSSETGWPLPVCRRSPLQRPHGLIAWVAVSPTPGNRLIVEALDVLEGEFASGNVGADLLDHAVMIRSGPRRSSDLGTASADTVGGFPALPISGRRCSRCGEGRHWDRVSVFQPLRQSTRFVALRRPQ
jgi:hypothetical protein